MVYGRIWAALIGKPHLSSGLGTFDEDSSISDRGRKAAEQKSLSDDERIDSLESQLKEAKYIAEDADRKYDEVNECMGVCMLPSPCYLSLAVCPLRYQGLPKT